MTVKIAPAAPTNFQALQNSAADAQAAALKMFETSKIDNSAAPVEEGDVEPKVEAQKVEVAEVDPDEGTPEAKEEKVEEKIEVKKDEGLPDPLRKSFEQLAKEKKALRDEQTAVKAEGAKFEKYRMLDAAVKNGDALGALAALGMGYGHVVKQLTGGKAPPEVEGATEEPEQGENPLAAEVRELRAIVQKDRFERGGERLLGKMNELTRSMATKLPNVAADPALVEEARQYLYDFTRETGAPPGANINESMQMALEAVEARESATVEKWKKRLGLTVAKATADNTPAATKSAVEQPASDLGSRKTLSNSHASSPNVAGSTRPETVEELQAKALRLLEAQG